MPPKPKSAEQYAEEARGIVLRYALVLWCDDDDSDEAAKELTALFAEAMAQAESAYSQPAAAWDDPI